MSPCVAKVVLGVVTLVAAVLLGAPVAVGEPEVPDLDALPRAATVDFFGPGSYTFAFRAGQDVWCVMNYSRFSNHSSCVGRLPGVSNGENYASVYWEMLDHTGSSQISSTSDTVPKPDQQPFYRPLPTGRVLWIGSNYEVGAHACGAPAGYLLVCRIDSKLPDQTPRSHGFVLSESGSWTF